ncbi:MAG TPA: DHHA1 domain-containing protein [Acidobacteriaceae bacterium]|nr:DHHA1 domain-containing protein [Acidobacteriaceae bacterium]
MSDRLYYADPSLASFDAHVSDIREVSRTEGRSLWQIALDRSAFYPTSGGQPHDTGVLTATSSGGALLEAPILAVEEDDQGEVWHTTPKPLLAGTPVRGYVDWSRRRDHMQQHSGQHLLSAVVYRQLGAATVSFHLGEMTSTIDLARETISPEELERVEDAVNEIIAENRAVTMRTIPRVEAEMLLAAGTLHKLPDRKGDIRLIEIDEIDVNACGGTHVEATGQIGALLIRGTERVRQGVRVEFVCGIRAMVTARQDLTTLTRTAATLSVGRLDVTDAVDRLLAEGRAANKARQKLTEELAGYQASSLLLELSSQTGRKVLQRTFADRDAGYLKLLASRMIASGSEICVLLASTQEEPARVIVAASPDQKVDCGTLLRDTLAVYGLRGGGSPTMAQGQIARVHLDALFNSIENGLKSVESC